MKMAEVEVQLPINEMNIIEANNNDLSSACHADNDNFSDGPVLYKNGIKVHKSLISSVQSGHTESVKFLLQAGACVNEKDPNGLTTLMLASREGNLEIVELLLNNNAATDENCNEGSTALILASFFGHANIVIKLINSGTDVNIQDSYGMTALMKACIKGYSDIVRHLIDHQASVNAKNNKGRTALMMATENAQVYYHSMCQVADASDNRQHGEATFATSCREKLGQLEKEKTAPAESSALPFVGNTLHALCDSH
uniref:Uncharacterized protein n=1 Tax=Biomphalaria glabrata TaxID=6526 RepID=A0A2C9M108_BIOGL